MNTFLTVIVVLMCAAVVSLATGWLIAERGHFLLPSSRKFIPGINFQPAVAIKSLFTYIYHRWPKLILGFLINVVHPYLNGPFKKYVREHYHGKVLTQELAEAVINLDHEIPLQDLGQHIIPYPKARDIVMQLPLDIVSYECGCRSARLVHCEPTQVCLIIGKPFTDFALEHHPKHSKRLTKEEAIQLLREENDRGHVHSAFFKEDRLNRFYVICNCCPCCCGGLEAMLKYHNPMIATSGYVARVDANRCLACGVCVASCPTGALTAHSEAVVEWELCIGCGVCVNRCNQEAISLQLDERKGIPLDVNAII
jgi:ferredoxin